MSGALTSSATLPALKGYGVAITKRCYRHLSAEDRETLSLGLGLIQGASLRALARVLGRAPSTLSREYARNTTRGRLYRARTAQTQAAPEPVSRGGRAHSWTLGCGSMSRHIWHKAARPSRLPDGFNARIL